MIYLNLNANILLNTSIVLIIGDIFFIFVLRYDLSTICPKIRLFGSFIFLSRAHGGDRGSGRLHCDAGSDSKERTETEKQKSSHENARKS